MSMCPAHCEVGADSPGNGGGRLNELLDQIRSEFETQMRTSEDYERQIQAQVNEIQLVREKVNAMEQTHMTLTQKYEEEIAHLRRQLDAPGGTPQGQLNGSAQHATPSPFPSIGIGNNVFGATMTGHSGRADLAPPPPSPHEQQPPQPQMPRHLPSLQGLLLPPSLPLSQQSPFQQQYPQGPAPGGFPSQPPQSTASPGASGTHAVGGRPPAGGPATPRMNTPIPYPGSSQSPQVAAYPALDHDCMQMPPSGHTGNIFGELEAERLPAHNIKTHDDWFVIFNQAVPRVLDVDLLHTLEHDSIVCCIRFSADGKYVATGCNRSARIYDVRTGENLCILRDDSVNVRCDLHIRSVCFSPDGKYLATGAEDKLIRVWDIQTRTIRNTFAGHEQDIYSLDFARDGRTIASGGGDRTVRLWDFETGSCVLTLSIGNGVTAVAISPDTKYVAAGSLDKSVHVWDIRHGFLVERLEGPDGHKDGVYSVAFSPNGMDLVTGSLAMTIKMWELNAPRGLSNQEPNVGRCVKTFEGHRDFVLTVALTPDASWVVSGSRDGGVQFWNPRTGSTQFMLQGHKNSVISVAPSPSGGYFATGSGDMRARIWSYSRFHGP